MNTSKTLTDARIRAKADNRIVSIMEIEHKDQGVCFICLVCPAEYMRSALKTKPMPEILSIIASHSIRTPQEQEEIAAKENNNVEIILSSRGWGDYSNCTYDADLRKSDTDLLAECRKAISDSNDVDHADQTDDELLAKISQARQKHAAKNKHNRTKTEKETHGAGYCYSCDSYCYGDCGNYQPENTTKMQISKLQKEASEENYGIND